MQVTSISIGCDHAGFPYKNAIKKVLELNGIKINDYGTHSSDSVDYPDFAHKVAADVQEGKVDLGVVMCGSGNGVAMTANKYSNVRAALCWKAEIAELARQHNNANVIAIPVRYVSEKAAVAMVNAFLKTDFEGGRHARRANKISCCIPEFTA